MDTYIAAYLIMINIIAFAVCAYDKAAAKKRRRRIRERTLFIIALIGGAAGMFVGMLIVRHKTRKRLFTLLMPLIIVFQASVLIYILSIQ